MVRRMRTELTMIATGRRVSDDRGDVRRWSETVISLESQVEESKVKSKSRRVVRSSRSVVEGCGEVSKAE